MLLERFDAMRPAFRSAFLYMDLVIHYYFRELPNRQMFGPAFKINDDIGPHDNGPIRKVSGIGRKNKPLHLLPIYIPCEENQAKSGKQTPHTNSPIPPLIRIPILPSSRSLKPGLRKPWRITLLLHHHIIILGLWSTTPNAGDAKYGSCCLVHGDLVLIVMRMIALVVVVEVFARVGQFVEEAFVGSFCGGGGRGSRFGGL